MEVICKIDFRSLIINYDKSVYPSKDELCIVVGELYCDSSEYEINGPYFILEGYNTYALPQRFFEKIPYSIHKQIYESLAAPTPKKQKLFMLFLKEHWRILPIAAYLIYITILIIKECLK